MAETSTTAFIFAGGGITSRYLTREKTEQAGMLDSQDQEMLAEPLLERSA